MNAEGGRRRAAGAKNRSGCSGTSRGEQKTSLFRERVGWRRAKQKLEAQGAGGDRGGEGNKGWSETLEKVVLSKEVKD